jgi:hypothetical protein
MKLIPRDSRHGISIFRLALTLTIAALVPLLAYATAPAWWSHQAVLVQNGTADDYALVNQGQLKNIARAAVTEMDAGLPGGAGNTLHALVDAWASPSAQTNDYAPVNLGQLKNIAKPFYDRLIAAGLAGGYPWSGNPNQPDDFALANIGQVKELFSFDLPNPFHLDIASGNGQQVPPGAWLPQPLVVRMTDDAGIALSNATVTFSTTLSGGALSATSGGSQVSSLVCHTNGLGEALVYYKTPMAEMLETVNAQAGDPGYVKQVTFTASTIGVNFPFVGLKLWLRGDAGVVKDASNAISQWIDGTGSGNDALQSSPANEPSYAADSINGKPVVRFDGVDDLFGLGDVMQSAAAGELFVVLRATGDPTADHGFMTFGPGGWDQWARYPAAGGNIRDNFGGTSRYMGRVPQALDQFHLYNALSKPGEWTSRINGVVQYTTSSNTVGFTSASVIGSSGSPYEGSFQGDIAEIIIYDHVLSQAERDAVEYYIGTKYPVLASPPAIPTMLRGEAIAHSQVGLSWTYDLGNGSTFFNVERKTAGGVFQEVAVTRNSASYIDTTTLGGTSYIYRVRATNYSGQSGYSTEVAIISRSGGTEMPLDGMRLWLKADAGTTNPMISWANQAQGGNLALQGTGDSQPHVIANQIEGKPVVHFDGSNDSVGLTDVMQGVTEGDLFVVLRTTGDPEADHGFMTFGPGGWGEWALYPDASGNIRDNFGGPLRNTGKPLQPLDEVHLYEALSKPGEWTNRVNGVVQYTTGSNTVSFTSAPVIGSSGSAFNGTFQGDIAEIIIYDRALSTIERDRVQWYLAAKYLIPGYDLDVDGLTNGEEAAWGTDPFNWDTNGDGISDGLSVQLGINPLGSGYPWPLPPGSPPPGTIPLGFTLTDPPNAVLLP